MTKRSASYDIDPITYEEKERDNGDDNLYAADASQIKNRKIYKLARKTQGTKLTAQSKPELKIIGFEASFAQKDPNLKNQMNEGTNSIFKTSISGLAQAGNFFSNLFSKDYNKPNSDNDVKSNQVPKPQLQTNKPKSSIFGSLFSQGPSSSIFSNNNNNSTSGNLFSLPGKSLFGGINLISSNDNSTKPANLFTKNEDGEEDGDSAELQQKQQMIVDPSKSQVKFDYGKQNIVLKTVRLLKFKKDKGQLLDCPMNASILRDHSKQVYYISIELQATHKIIFSGLILKGKSIVKTLNNKPQNLEILAFSIDSKQKKLQNHILKLQISTENNTGEEIEFHSTLNQIIEGKTISSNLGDTK